MYNFYCMHTHLCAWMKIEYQSNKRLSHATLIFLSFVVYYMYNTYHEIIAPSWRKNRDEDRSLPFDKISSYINIHIVPVPIIVIFYACFMVIVNSDTPQTEYNDVAYHSLYQIVCLISMHTTLYKNMLPWPSCIIYLVCKITMYNVQLTAFHNECVFQMWFLS